MYQYTAKFVFEKENYYPIKANDVDTYSDYKYLKIAKSALCDIKDIQEEITGLFSPRLGKIKFISINTEEIDKLGLVKRGFLNEYSSISIEYITSARVRCFIDNNYGRLINENTPNEREFGSITVEQIEKVIQYDISSSDHLEYLMLGNELLSKPYAAANQKFGEKCLLKLKNGYYALCRSSKKDCSNKITTDYIAFFKEKGLYELQTFDDYKEFVSKIKRG